MEPTNPSGRSKRKRRIPAGWGLPLGALVVVLGAGVYFDVIREPAGKESADASAAGRAALSTPRAASDVAAFPEAFPRIDLVEGLLDAPESMGRRRGWGPQVLEMVPWPDGTPVLLTGSDGRYDALGGDRAVRATWKTTDWVHHVCMLRRPHGRTCAVVNLRAPLGVERPESTAGLDADGVPTWSWEPGRPYVKALAVLHGTQGEAGVVVGVGGEKGLVALDLDGKELWQLERRHVVYGVHTHPGLPGRVLLVSGAFELFAHGDGAEPPRILLARGSAGPGRSAPRLAQRYCSEGALFPDAQGRAVLVLGGTKLFEDKAPYLAALGEDATERWSARPGTEIDELVLVEPPGRPRLLVATTEGGELLVLDDEGALRARATLPEAPQPGGRVATYALAAGPLGADGYAIAVGLLGGTHLYRLHPERLPPR